MGQCAQLETAYTKEPTRAWQRASYRTIGIGPRKSALVGRVQPDSPAALAGIRRNDIIAEVDGLPLLAPEALSAHIDMKGEGSTIRLGVRRGESFEVEVQPELPIFPEDYTGDRKPMIGVAWDLTGLWTVDRPGPVDADQDECERDGEHVQSLVHELRCQGPAFIGAGGDHADLLCAV